MHGEVKKGGVDFSYASVIHDYQSLTSLGSSWLSTILSLDNFLN